MVLVQKRPVILSIACILGFIGVVISFPNIFSPFVKQLGIWFPSLFGTIISLRFMSLVGIWFMKKWGVLLFSGVFIFNEIMRTLINDVSYFELCFSALLCIIFLWYFKFMDGNL